MKARRILIGLVAIETVMRLATCTGWCAPAATPPITEQLWPTVAASDHPSAEETVLPDQGDHVKRITHVTDPSITVFPTDRAGPSPAIVVCPGGGYSILAIDKEGTDVAEWLNSIGFTAIVLKYSVPNNRQGAFRDVQRAMRRVRYQAKEWNIDPERMGIMGFSAGGHLAARLSTGFGNDAYTAIDEADKKSCRPDFCVLIYPAYLVNKAKELADELPVSPDVPSTFIVHTKDDRAFIAGSVAYDQALKEVGVLSEFCLFPEGGHGYGLRSTKHPVSTWPKRCEEWLEATTKLKTTSRTDVYPVAKGSERPAPED